MPTKITCAGCNKTDELRASMRKVEALLQTILGLLYDASWDNITDPDQRDEVYASMARLSHEVEDINA